MIRSLLTCAATVLIFSCQAQPAHDNHQELKAEVRLTSPSEPGTPMTISIKVLDYTTRKPVANAEVFVYHTNAKGDYENDKNGLARINGTALSSQDGKVIFHTIYPRGYNDSESGEHIHFRVKADGYRSSNLELVFETDQSIPSQPNLHKVYLEELKKTDNSFSSTAVLFLRRS